jgi:hypothetical protein
MILQSQLQKEIVDDLTRDVAVRRKDAASSTWIDMYCKTLEGRSNEDNVASHIPDAAPPNNAALCSQFDDDDSDIETEASDPETGTDPAPPAVTAVTQSPPVADDETNACPFEEQDFIWWSICRLLVHANILYSPYQHKKPDARFLGYMSIGVTPLNLLWKPPHELKNLRLNDPAALTRMLEEAAAPMFNKNVKMNNL